MPEVPLPPEVPVDPVKVLVARNDAEGLHLHARTAVPGWMGEYLDVGWAIGILHPLAREAYESVIQKRAEQPMRVAYERRNGDLDPQLVRRGGRAGLERPGCSGPPRHR
jgi:hypothetical protein